MSYTLYKNTPQRRSGLLGMVIGAHVLLALGLMTVKVVAPHIAEVALIVDLIEETQQPPKVQTQAVPKPLPTPLKTSPKAAPPVLDTTSSSLAANAPVAPPLGSHPAPVEAATAEPISQARFDADYLKNPPPPYPPLARRAGEEGKVVLRVSVSPQGSADGVDIKISSGSNRLDEAAAKTVRNWRFVPAKRGDSAIQSWVLVPIIFKLEH